MSIPCCYNKLTRTVIINGLHGYGNIFLHYISYEVHVTSDMVSLETMFGQKHVGRFMPMLKIGTFLEDRSIHLVVLNEKGMKVMTPSLVQVYTELSITKVAVNISEWIVVSDSANECP